MKRNKIDLHNGVSGAALTIKVLPGHQKNEIVRIEKDGLVIVGLKTLDSDFEINGSLKTFISELLQIPKPSVEIVAGKSGNEKLISVINTNAAIIQGILEPFVE